MQKAVLTPALSGRDILLQSQTGSGKTLAFLLPLIERLAHDTDGTNGGAIGSTALLLAPTAVLAEQHAGTARLLAAALTPPLDVGCDTESTSALDPRISPPELLVATPGALRRLLSSGEVGRAWAARLSIVAIDECDAVLCGGAYDDTLTPDATQLLSALPPMAQYLLATAYLTLQHELALNRRFRQAVRVAEPTDAGKPTVMVPTLRQVFHYLGPDADRAAALLSSLRAADSDAWLCEGTTMVFCHASSAILVHAQLVRQMPHLAPALLILDQPRSAPAEDEDHPAPHPLTDQGSASTGVHASAVADFAAGRARVLVCTAAAARGLDFPALRHVVLYDMPTDVAGFVHSAGRTARRGSRGLVTCLVQSEEEVGRFRDLHGLLPARALDFS
jgi:superfamily II DNA/RNA helicase